LIAGAELSVRYEKDDSSRVSTLSNEDGTYALAVQVNQKMSLEVTKENFSFQAVVLDTTSLKAQTLKIEAPDLKIDTLQEGSAYPIEAIVFDTDDAQLSADAQLLLKGFAAYLKKQDHLTIQINGHTDDIGDAQRNLLLSEKRAAAVAQYLIFLGVKEAQLQHKGFGETQPRVANDSEMNRALNRRTEFEILAIN
jgi:outer membrane protein OmpA-like peptidoglycan-associated protein